MTNKKKVAAAAFALTAILLNILICLTNSDGKSVLNGVLMCAAIDVTAIICIRYMEELLRIPLEIYRDREVFMTLVKNDFQARFAGSYLGRFWAYVQPVITILLYWFVFQIGLRSGDVSDHPFILFLMAGLVPWFYFSEALVGATGSLIEYNYLVKKVVFNVGFLPVLKVLSSLFVHGFFVAIVVILSLIYGYGFDWYLLQIIYYGFCLAFFVLGISHITAACTVFFKDMTQIVNIFLTIGIWLTPIMWNPQMTMPASLQKLFEVNPVYYIVDGYRDALLDKMWFWEKPEWSIYFWCLTIVIYVLGVKMFNRLKGHFPDVL